jgi:hypothetical protein
MASKEQGPPSWQDALASASQAIAAGMSAPDADIKFGLAMIGALSTHQQRKSAPQSGGAGAGAPGGPAGGGDAGSPPSGGPGMSPAASTAGGGQPNSAMPSTGGPGGPTPGGMSQGLGLSGPGNNPDELRRVLADVAGK